MGFEDIKIIKVEEGPRINQLKKDFYRMIFHYSDRPTKGWMSFFSEEYEKVKISDTITETIDEQIIIQCKLDELQNVLDSLKVAAITANVKYESFLIEKQKENNIASKIHAAERKKVEEAIKKLHFD